MYNYLPFFLTALGIVLGTIVGWFLSQWLKEKKILS